MYLPIWLMITIVYLIVLGLCVLRNPDKQTGYEFYSYDGSWLYSALCMGVATIVYLLFWIVYLAIG